MVEHNPNGLNVEIVHSLSDIEIEQWNALAQKTEILPFLEYEYLAALENSGCVSPETGWIPNHFVIRDRNKLIAAAPAYIKSHSMGEFIFDQSFAVLSDKLEIPYYPKLIAAVPFTPIPGYEFLVEKDYGEQQLSSKLWKTMRDSATEENYGSSSVLFANPDWNETADSIMESSVLRWIHQSFLWENTGFENFRHYADSFKKNQRRNILREWKSTEEQGLVVETLTGSSLSEAVMDEMFQFYVSTNEKFGPYAAFYLNREFFREIGRTWNEQIVIFRARCSRTNETEAMSLVVKKDKRLAGRYWGSRRFIPNLHFNLCYYTPIEYAIRNGLSFFDPGMGSVHKVRRGFISREFITYHHFKDKNLAGILRFLIGSLNQNEQSMVRELNSLIPRKKIY